MRALWALALLASGCLCLDPWTKYPRAAPPDEEYSTGSSTHGDEVYVWRCVDGERIVVIFTSAEMSCAGARRETAACDQRTPYELETPAEARHAIRDGRSWRTKSRR